MSQGRTKKLLEGDAWEKHTNLNLNFPNKIDKVTVFQCNYIFDC